MIAKGQRWGGRAAYGSPFVAINLKKILNEDIIDILFSGVQHNVVINLDCGHG